MTNLLLEMTATVNRYFVMRHGHSEANRLGVIVSDPANGVPELWIECHRSSPGKGIIVESRTGRTTAADYQFRFQARH